MHSFLHVLINYFSLFYLHYFSLNTFVLYIFIHLRITLCKNMAKIIVSGIHCRPLVICLRGDAHSSCCWLSDIIFYTISAETFVLSKRLEVKFRVSLTLAFIRVISRLCAPKWSVGSAKQTFKTFFY